MEWDVLLDEDFAAWLDGLDAALRNEILAHAALLRARGPHLGRPYVDTLEGSAFMNMKELRIQFHGDPWRVLFAFDPNRRAILLVGRPQSQGDPAGRWKQTGRQAVVQEEPGDRRRAIPAAPETSGTVRYLYENG